MTIFELAIARLEECGMTKDGWCAKSDGWCERFGATAGKDVPWADIAPRLDKQQIERIDSAGVGWMMRTSHCVGGSHA